VVVQHGDQELGAEAAGWDGLVVVVDDLDDGLVLQQVEAGMLGAFGPQSARLGGDVLVEGFAAERLPDPGAHVGGQDLGGREDVGGGDLEPAGELLVGQDGQQRRVAGQVAKAAFDASRSWLLGEQRPLARVLAFTAAAILVVAGIALLARGGWWRLTAVVGLGVSTVLLLVYFTPWFLFILAVNAALIVGIVFMGWPSKTTVGA
jgi:hypothetical protein